MEADIEIIRERIGQGRYTISFTHTEKLRQRRIKAEDIEQALEMGKIIEDYLEDQRGASCLILGFVGERPLHVLCGRLDAEEILIIPAYEPNPAEWGDDCTTRKRG
jgi:Domain of unknown function (DUF4258)